MRISEKILDELMEIMWYRHSLPLKGRALEIIDSHIGPIEKLLDDVPGDTIEQKVHRMFHELQVAHERIEELDVDIPN